MLLGESGDREHAGLKVHEHLVQTAIGWAGEIIRQVESEIATGGKARNGIARHGILIAPITIAWQQEVLLSSVQLEYPTESRLIDPVQFLGGYRHRIIPSALRGISYDEELT